MLQTTPKSRAVHGPAAIQDCVLKHHVPMAGCGIRSAGGQADTTAAAGRKWKRTSRDVVLRCVHRLCKQRGCLNIAVEKVRPDVRPAVGAVQPAAAVSGGCDAICRLTEAALHNLLLCMPCRSTDAKVDNMGVASCIRFVQSQGAAAGVLKTVSDLSTTQSAGPAASGCPRHAEARRSQT